MRRWGILAVATGVLGAFAPSVVGAQGSSHEGHAGHAGMVGAADRAMSGPSSPYARLHLELSPSRPGTKKDTITATQLAREVREAIAKYADPAVAEADGYRLFLPNVKTQKVFHYTNYRHAVAEAFRFDVTKPTSLLYERTPDGAKRLVGAMYTMPRRASVERLDERIPLSIAQWHKHVNWCVPTKGQERRWLERRDGHPVFGPESPIATKDECDAVGGEFHPNLFGWMVHVNAFAGSDLHAVFGHEH